MYSDLKGKTVIITGAGREKGIGFGIAKRFAGEGCNVAIVNRAHPEVKKGETDDLEKRKLEIQALGAKCLAIRCDVTVEEEVQSMVDSVVREFGRLDIMVNNVGGAKPNHLGPLVNMDAVAWDESLTMNVKGTHLGTRAAVKQMIAQGNGGKVVNTSSQAGVSPDCGLGLYSTAKAAINHYTRIMAKETAQYKINVNAVLPGTIMTEQLKRVLVSMTGNSTASDAELAGLLPPIPWGRLQTPEDVAAAVLWLSSSESDYVTGACLLVTGGQTM
jgi:NAD(P)-dependent dehydrogenase (short-subunit alcohol dehydrogenase family)